MICYHESNETVAIRNPVEMFNLKKNSKSGKFPHEMRKYFYYSSKRKSCRLYDYLAYIYLTFGLQTGSIVFLNGSNEYQFTMYEPN